MEAVLETQKYLREYGLDSLEKKFSLKVSRHKIYNNLVQLRYDQLESPLGETIVQECRGLIVDEKDNWKVIAFPYTKFFNFGEGNASNINWNGVRVYEKVDGSLMVLYKYNNEWFASTTSVPDGSGRVRGLWNERTLALKTGLINKEEQEKQDRQKDAEEGIVTFSDLFWEIWNKNKCEFPEDDSHCYMFEIVSSKCQVVVRYESDELYIHGARDLKTFEEKWPESFGTKFNWKCVPSFQMDSLNDVLESVKKLDPIRTEGYVICDKDFNRVKIKSPSYVALSLLCHDITDDNMNNKKRMIEIIRHNEGSEFLAYFPYFKDLYDETFGLYIKLVERVEKLWESVKDINDQREFAKTIVADSNLKLYSSYLFARRKGDVKNAKEFFAKSTVKNLERFVDLERETNTQ